MATTVLSCALKFTKDFPNHEPHEYSQNLNHFLACPRVKTFPGFIGRCDWCKGTVLCDLRKHSDPFT